jgi:hypothetical protein
MIPAGEGFSSRSARRVSSSIFLPSKEPHSPSRPQARPARLVTCNGGRPLVARKHRPRFHPNVTHNGRAGPRHRSSQQINLDLVTAIFTRNKGASAIISCIGNPSAEERRSVGTTPKGPPRALGTPLSRRRPNPCPGRGSHWRGASAGDAMIRWILAVYASAMIGAVIGAAMIGQVIDTGIGVASGAVIGGAIGCLLALVLAAVFSRTQSRRAR